MAAAKEITVHSSLGPAIGFDTINDVKNYFLSIKYQLPSGAESFDFIAKSHVFDICTFTNTKFGGSYFCLASFDYAGEKPRIQFSLYSLQGEQWSEFLKQVLNPVSIVLRARIYLKNIVGFGSYLLARPERRFVSMASKIQWGSTGYNLIVKIHF